MHAPHPIDFLDQGCECCRLSHARRSTDQCQSVARRGECTQCCGHPDLLGRCYNLRQETQSKPDATVHTVGVSTKAPSFMVPHKIYIVRAK